MTWPKYAYGQACSTQQQCAHMHAQGHAHTQQHTYTHARTSSLWPPFWYTTASIGPSIGRNAWAMGSAVGGWPATRAASLDKDQ